MLRAKRITHRVLTCRAFSANSTAVAKNLPTRTWRQLHRAAKLARWSGLCYIPWNELPAAVAAEHLTLVASGRTKYTAWYIADGCVDDQQLINRVQPPGSAAHEATGGPPPRERFVFLRGVHWSAPDSDNTFVSRQLVDFWPTPFAEGPLPAPSPLVAHRGAAFMATPLFAQLLPHISPPGSTPPPTSPPQAPSDPPSPSASPRTDTPPSPGPARTRAAVPAATNHQQQPEAGVAPHTPPPDAGPAEEPPTRLTFAGHSMGGSLAKLLCILARLQTPWSPDALSCHTFGSPPVLAHRDGGGGRRALRTVGLRPHQIVNYVLENDPVPRAMLSADPYFSMVKDIGAVKALLQVREWLLGEGAALSTGRFLFENVGDVLLITWSSEGGTVVEQLEPGQAEQRLVMAAVDFQQQPLKSLQAVLDHSHASYSHELDLAALLAARRALFGSRKSGSGAARGGSSGAGNAAGGGSGGSSSSSSSSSSTGGATSNRAGAAGAAAPSGGRAGAGTASDAAGTGGAGTPATRARRASPGTSSNVVAAGGAHDTHVEANCSSAGPGDTAAAAGPSAKEQEWNA